MGSIIFGVSFCGVVLIAWYLIHRKYNKLEKEIIEPIVEKTKTLVSHETKWGFLDEDKITVRTPSLYATWLYKEEDGIDVFVCGDFKIYSQGDLWVGTLNTNIKSEPFFNKLVQKFANAAMKNNYIIDPSLCVPVQTPKTKKKT